MFDGETNKNLVSKQVRVTVLLEIAGVYKLDYCFRRMKAKKDSKFGLNYDFPTSPGDINMNQNSGFSGNKGYFMDNTLADPSYGGKNSCLLFY